jgi:hypothetical protein
MIYFTNIFYEDLEQYAKMTIDAAASGNLMNMGAQNVYKLINDMTFIQQQWSSVRGNIRAIIHGMLETDLVKKLAAQIKAMKKSIDRMSISNVSVVNLRSPCAIYGVNDHLAINCGWGRTSEGRFEHVNTLNNNNF